MKERDCGKTVEEKRRRLVDEGELYILPETA